MTEVANADRTQEEIVTHLKDISKEDYFGFQSNNLLEYLDFDHAKQFLKETATQETWEEGNYPLPKDRDNVLKQMEDYMDFAWEKANNERGVSAGRSMAHYTAWVWILGDEEKFGDLEKYQYYGKDNLRQLCEVYGWNADQWDDGHRSN